jgi:hypothetical protein
MTIGPPSVPVSSTCNALPSIASRSSRAAATSPPTAARNIAAATPSNQVAPGQRPSFFRQCSGSLLSPTRMNAAVSGRAVLVFALPSPRENFSHFGNSPFQSRSGLARGGSRMPIPVDFGGFLRGKTFWPPHRLPTFSQPRANRNNGERLQFASKIVAS